MKSKFIIKEKLSIEDEKRIKALIRIQLKAFLWNLYSKQAVILN